MAKKAARKAKTRRTPVAEGTNSQERKGKSALPAETGEKPARFSTGSILDPMLRSLDMYRENGELDASRDYELIEEKHPIEAISEEEFPSVGEIARLAALIGQGQPEAIKRICNNQLADINRTFDDEAFQQNYADANNLANAALILWRASHDMRRIWLGNPSVQRNKSAAIIQALNTAEASFQKQDRQQLEHEKLVEILQKLVKPNSGTSIEEWTDGAFTPWSKAAALLYPTDDVKSQDSNLATLLDDWLKQTDQRSAAERKKLIGSYKAEDAVRQADESDQEKIFIRRDERGKVIAIPEGLGRGIPWEVWHSLLVFWNSKGDKALSEKMSALGKHGGKMSGVVRKEKYTNRIIRP